jgi:chromosome segregation protein
MGSRLKSLELIGYKTFATKTNLEFPGRITAIVGPNGSGKSNVADSIRWVLGEQSFRLLRGRRTEDMIFAGSQSRSRSGMASSSITFNNEDGWLPIEYAEVSITRRAYRDGQNEYLLNGQKVRLREIQELLAQSGLAERTYTLIGQGLVDAALSIKAEERRKFFEEAAGIGLYRSRREEAINRLDQTRRNLERVQDILSELSPRLKSLERQARRFLDYQTVQADLQVLLTDWYGFHWHKAQHDLNESRAVLRERESRLKKTQAEFEKFDQVMATMRQELQSVRAELNEWHAESAAFHQEREAISKNLAVMDERQRAMNDQKRNLTSDITRLEEDIHSRKVGLTAVKAEYERLMIEFEEANQQKKQNQASLNERKQKRDEIERELRNQRRSLLQKETKVVELNAKSNELVERLKSLIQSREKLKEDQALTLKRQEEAETVYKSAQSGLNEAENQRKKVEEEVNQLTQEIRQHEETLNGYQKEQNLILGQQARLNAQLDVLIEAENSLSGLNQGSQSILKAVKSGQIKGDYQPLSTYLEVPKTYEMAITAALGEYLDAVVIFDQSDPEEAMHLLSQKDKGRAVLLPISWMRDLTIEKSPIKDGFLSRANEIFNVDPKVQKILDGLLGNTFIVNDRSAAKEKIKHIPTNMRLVTLDGEIFNGNGPVFAGKENRSAVIARPRQKKELQESIVVLEKQNEEISKKIEQLEKNITQKKEKNQGLRNQLNIAIQKFQEEQKNIQKISLSLEQARQRNEWIKEQLVNSEKQIIQSEQAQKSCVNEKKICEQESTVLRETVREISHQLDGIPLDELQSQVNHWGTNAAVAERAANQAKTRLQEYEQLLDQNQKRYQLLKRRLEDFDMNLEDIDDEKASQRAIEQDLNDKIETYREKISPAEKRLRTLEEEYTKQQEEQSSVQQMVSMAERHVTQGQLEHSRVKDGLDNLRRRIEEDFGLVAFEYSSNISGANPLPLDGLVQQLPVIEEIEPELEQSINNKRAQLRRIGPINPDADEEYKSVRERHEFISNQMEDLKKADQDLREVIAELDELMQREFRKTFDAVAAEFKIMFTRLFGGGSARLVLTDEENFQNTGIDIEARLPGRREQGLSLLSGGERSLTAVALIFALLKISPTPFCVLDEVDAALDEANVGRFCDLLQELSQQIQFIVITHNRNTVQASDVIYGITMGRDSASQMISLRLDEVSDDMVG